MTNPLIRFTQLVWNHTGWKELNEFIAKSIEHEEEMTVLIRKLVQQRDDAFDIAFIAIAQRDKTLAYLESQNFILSNAVKKDRNVQ